MGLYMDYALKLVEEGKAYYCFCTKDRLDTLKVKNDEGVAFASYDRHCYHLSKEEIEENLKNNVPFVIRQLMPTEGKTAFKDAVYGEISVDNSELDDQILIKSDGFPTYNFANVVDDHLMNITHVVRGSEYLSSTPKYNLLYDAFEWDSPEYIHLPPVMRDAQNKFSKRHGDKSFEELVNEGYISEAIVNYIALLGWSPSDNQEIFTMTELIEMFDIKGLSKSPAIFDIKKLTWMNGEYIKKMDFGKYYECVEPKLKDAIKCDGIDIKFVAEMLKTRLETLNDIKELVDFVDALPEYSTELYVHKKMKTNEEIALSSLKLVMPVLEAHEDWTNDALYEALSNLAQSNELKNGQILWPVRTALSGKPTSPGGASELAVLFGKNETISRIKKGIELLENQ